jgi:hypothetical protein
MITTHSIEDITFEANTMIITIDGNPLRFSLDKVSKKLKEASEVQRLIYKVSPSGYGIHWPMIDEDLSVEALLKVA